MGMLFTRFPPLPLNVNFIFSQLFFGEQKAQVAESKPNGNNNKFFDHNGNEKTLLFTYFILHGCNVVGIWQFWHHFSALIISFDKRARLIYSIFPHKEHILLKTTSRKLSRHLYLLYFLSTAVIIFILCFLFVCMCV